MLEDEVKALLADGQLLDAVKHARASLGSSLKEAKGYVDCIALHGFPPPDGMFVRAVNARILELREILRGGGRAAAIEGYRTLSGASAEEAEATMDVWHEQHESDRRDGDAHPDDRPWG